MKIVKTKIKSNSGFTLIELLIVITLIGILSIALIPFIVNVGAKGRDTQRISDLTKLSNALILRGAEEGEFPTGLACVGSNNGKFEPYISSLGGSLPLDPQDDHENLTCTGQYFYKSNPYGYGVEQGVAEEKFDFVILAQVETFEKANTDCRFGRRGLIREPSTKFPQYWCFAILQK